jgi:hypothetical protein
MEQKRVSGNVMPPALTRLAAVLAEIALNETDPASVDKPVCASEVDTKQETKNP